MNPKDDRLEVEAQRLEEDAAPNNHLEELLFAIPPETPLVSLASRLQPLWEALSIEDDITAALFIEKTLKDYFGLRKSDLKPFHRACQKTKKAFETKKGSEKKEQEKTELLDRDINSSEALAAISTIGIVDPRIFDLVVAAYVAAKLHASPPIWLLLVGAPSSFKTELVRLIDLPEIYSLDTLTENAFASGYVMPDGSDPDDLLPLLDGKCFVIKDLTTLFSLKEDSVKKILGDLTSIFDGKYEKFTATRGEVRYCSRFSMVTCITPAILGKHQRYMHQLGGRFFFIRVPDLTPETLKRGHEIAWNPIDREQLIKQARQIVSTYCYRLSEKAVALYPMIRPETPAVQEWINIAADFIARARGTTETKHLSFEKEKTEGGEKEKIDYYEVSNPQIEQPWRILNQLRSLARVLAAMREKVVVTEAELESLKAIAVSSMPIDRAVVIAELLKEDKLTAREIGERINKSAKTAGRDLKELSSLGLVLSEEVNDPKTGRDAKGYSLKAEYKKFLAGISPPEIPF
ncbi:MAG: hypothetical protein Q7S32_01265 [bacterium]|nr:hypothetical protein [bacterium]